MRRFLLILIFLLCAISIKAQSPIVIRSTGGSWSSGTTFTATPWTNTAGDSALVVVFVSASGLQPISLSDGVNSYQPLFPNRGGNGSCPVSGAGGITMCAFLAVNLTAGSHTLTATVPSSISNGAINAVELSGASFYALDIFNLGVVPSFHASSITGSITTKTANTTVLAFANCACNLTGITATGFTSIASYGAGAQQVAVASISEASATTITPTVSATSGGDGFIDNLWLVAIRSIEPSPGAVQWTWNSTYRSGPTSSFATTLPYNVRAGDCIAVHVDAGIDHAGDTPLVSDNNADAHYMVPSYLSTGLQDVSFYFTNVVGGTTTITLSTKNSTAISWTVIYEEIAHCGPHFPYVNSGNQWSGGLAANSISTGAITLNAGTYYLPSFLNPTSTLANCSLGSVLTIVPDGTADTLCDATVTLVSPGTESQTFSTISGGNFGGLVFANLMAFQGADFTGAQTSQLYFNFGGNPVTLPGVTRFGSRLMVCATWQSPAGGTPTATDTLGNTYTLLFGSNADQYGVWLSSGNAGGSDTISVSGLPGNSSMQVGEIVNVTGIDVDATNFNIGTVSPITATTSPAADANDFVVSCLQSTRGSGSLPPNFFQGQSGYQFKSTPNDDNVGTGWWDMSGGSIGTQYITSLVTTDTSSSAASASVVAFGSSLSSGSASAIIGPTASVGPTSQF